MNTPYSNLPLEYQAQSLFDELRKLDHVPTDLPSIAISGKEMVERFVVGSIFIGIYTDLEYYHVAWLLNRQFKLDFRCVHEDLHGNQDRATAASSNGKKKTLMPSKRSTSLGNGAALFDSVAFTQPITHRITYQYRLPNSNYLHVLYDEHNAGHPLLLTNSKKDILKKVSYIWMIQTEAPDCDAAFFLEAMAKIDGIHFTQLIDPSKLRLGDMLL